MENDTLWGYRELSKYLRRSISQLRKDVMLGRLPHVKLACGKNAAVRFDPAEIRATLKRSVIRR